MKKIHKNWFNFLYSKQFFFCLFFDLWCDIFMRFILLHASMLPNAWIYAMTWNWKNIDFEDIYSIFIYICLFLSVQLWMCNVWPQLTMPVWDAHSNRVKEQHCSFLSFISHTSFCAGLMVVMKFADDVCVLSTFVFEWSLTLIELLCVSLKEKWLSICNTEHTIHTQNLTHSDQLQKSDTKLN